MLDGPAWLQLSRQLMHLRWYSDHIENSKQYLSKEIMILGLSCQNKCHRHILLLFVQLIV